MTSSKAKAPPGDQDSEVIRRAEVIFAKMGMTPQEAIRKTTAGEDLIDVGSVNELMSKFRGAGAYPDDEV